MKLRSGRTCDTRHHSIIQDVGLSGHSPDSSSTSATPPYLPPELRQNIIESIFEPCTLRRHIIDELLQQKQTPTSGRYDGIVRRAAIAWMHDAERDTYRKVRQELLDLSLVNSEFRLLALAAEQKWLKNMPMDITAWTAFCAAASPGTTDVVIELFPRNDFLDPPTFINEGIDVTKGIPPVDRLDRAALRERLRRLPAAVVATFPGALAMETAFLLVDLSIIGSLHVLWKREVVKLPEGVQRVRIDAKTPVIAHGEAASGEQGIKTARMLSKFRKTLIKGGKTGVQVECVAWRRRAGRMILRRKGALLFARRNADRTRGLEKTPRRTGSPVIFYTVSLNPCFGSAGVREAL